MLHGGLLQPRSDRDEQRGDDASMDQITLDATGNQRGLGAAPRGTARRRFAAANVFAKAAMASWLVLAAMPVAVLILALT